MTTSFMFMGCLFVYETSYGKFGKILYDILLKSIPCWPQYSYISVVLFTLAHSQLHGGMEKKAKAGCLVAFSALSNNPK